MAAVMAAQLVASLDWSWVDSMDHRRVVRSVAWMAAATVALKVVMTVFHLVVYLVASTVLMLVDLMGQ